jgi:hypothetical protein
VVQPARQPATVPAQVARLAAILPGAAVPEPHAVNRQILKALERIGRNGGVIAADPPPRRYGLHGGTHVNISQVLCENLWRFRLPPTARDILDHMAATHDEQGLVTAGQKELGRHFGCSQAKISRCLAMLVRHHFVWKASRRGVYQLNPAYAYRFGSRKHHALLERLGQETLDAHAIVVPLPHNEPR